MANDEVLGPRKTMFVLVIVVGCFAVLWPRILSPLIMGNAKEQIKPNQFDREAGCCEVIFESEVATLELLNELCSSTLGNDGKLSPYAAAECRKTVNETCGVDIAAFLKKSNNVPKTTKMLLDTLKSSNSSCLRDNFGIPIWSLSAHIPVNSWILQFDTLKQERPVKGVGPHPALRERGRAIPAGAPTPPSRGPVPLPPHIRVGSSPLSVYFDMDIKPPPIPGMRPPLGSPGGPVTAPKSSMGFVMPIYTICIIVFFVYTLSKILFKRTGTVPYDQMPPDPQFRRRVFRDDSRSSPETKFVVTAISGLVAEVQHQMEASYAQNQQRQDALGNNSHPYTNGNVANNAPVRIIATEYREKDKIVEEKEPTPEKSLPEPVKEESPEKEVEIVSEIPDSKSSVTNNNLEEEYSTKDNEKVEELEESPEKEDLKLKDFEKSNGDVVKHEDDFKKLTEDFLRETKEVRELEDKKNKKQSTPELLEEALQESDEEVVEEEVEEEEVEVSDEEPIHDEPEKSTVKPETSEVKSIFLETEIPQQSKVLVTEFAEDRPDRPQTKKHSPLVVSGKMTLSLIQDAPRETPERDAESTFDDFTTASALTQPAENKGESSEEEIEVEEIEEEVEVEEIEEEEEEDLDEK